MDAISDVKQSRLQQDGSDVTSFDVSVKLSDTGWGCSVGSGRSVDVRTQIQSPVPERMPARVAAR